ncbi:ribonuclease H-like domain-containing protein [Tanacetum coccineum]
MRLPSKLHTLGIAINAMVTPYMIVLGIIVNRLKSGSYRVKSVDLDLFKLAIVLQKAKQIQDFGPTSGIRASRGTLMMMKHHSMKMHQTMAIEMEHYLEYIDNDVWKVIQNGNSKKRISIGKDGVIRVLPPVSAIEIPAVEKERKARTILLIAIPKEHLRRFHGMDDAKEIWEAIRTRFGGNANSKKMQKAVLKQQFEAFTISSSEGLEKGYDRFQQLLSQLEAHGAEVSTEDANHKFLRSLPPAWSNLAMTMRTKPDVDTLSIDDLYNNLRVFEQELTSTSKSSASAQNVAFVSHSKSSTNKVKSGHTGAYSTYTPSTSSNNIPEREVPAGFADEVIYSLFAKQSEDLDLLHEDLEQIDDMDIEEMDINWQIAMIAIRMKKFYKKTGRRVRIDGNKPVGFDKKKLECFKCHNTGHFARECPSKGTNDGKKRDSFYQDQGAGKKEQNQNCLLTMDDGVVNWGEHTEEEVETNHALMAISSNNEVSLCSKTCIDSYNKLKTLCDEQTNQLGEQEVKILAYDQAVKKLEAQVVTFQKQQLSLNEQLTFQANALYVDLNTQYLPDNTNIFSPVRPRSPSQETRRTGILHGYKGMKLVASSNIIRQIENQLNHRYSNARTPQQNGVAERMNKTLIEAARTMLADSLLPTTFWAEVVSTACYIFNRKPKNKATSTNSVNSGSGQDNTQPTNQDDSDMPELNNTQPADQDDSDKQSSQSFNKNLMKGFLMRLLMMTREEPKKISEALKDDSWVEAMQEEFIKFSLQLEPWIHERVLLTRLRHIKEGKRRISCVSSVTPKTSHLNAVKRIFKYLKGKPNLGLWYPRESSFDLEAYSDSDYARANLDRKSTTVATSTIEAEYVAAASCCGQITLEYTIIEATDRSKLQLADASRDFHVTKYEIFDGMGSMGNQPMIFGNIKRGFRGVPRPLLPAMLPVVAVDQSSGTTDQAKDQPSSSAPLPSSSHPPMISATLASEPTPVAEPTTHHPSPSPESDNEQTEHIFEQPSLEHQPLSPRQETERNQEKDIMTLKRSSRVQKENFVTPLNLIDLSSPEELRNENQQEEASLAEAIRLQTLEEEETAKQVYLDALLAKRMEEEEELTEQQTKKSSSSSLKLNTYTEKIDFAKKMVKLVNQRKKFFAEERAKARRSKPMTQSLLRNYMMNYLKNQETWKLTQLKKLSFEEVKEEFDKLVKHVESLVFLRNHAATKGTVEKKWKKSFRKRFQRNKGLMIKMFQLKKKLLK